MNLLIGLVIATFIITGAYIGYHVSLEQSHEADDVKGHSSAITGLEMLGNNPDLAHTPYQGIIIANLDIKSDLY